MQDTKNINYVNKVKKKKSSNNSKEQKDKLKCYRCGRTNHTAKTCYAKNLKCTNCNREGHLKKVCFKTAEINKVDEEDNVQFENVHTIHSLQSNDTNISKYKINLFIDKAPCTMELDTGAALSIISYDKFKRICPQKQLEKTQIKLRTYMGEIIKPEGVCKVLVNYEDQKHKLPLYVIRKSRCTSG